MNEYEYYNLSPEERLRVDKDYDIMNNYLKRINSPENNENAKKDECQ